MNMLLAKMFQSRRNRCLAVNSCDTASILSPCHAAGYFKCYPDMIESGAIWKNSRNVSRQRVTRRAACEWEEVSSHPKMDSR